MGLEKAKFDFESFKFGWNHSLNVFFLILNFIQVEFMLKHALVIQ